MLGHQYMNFGEGGPNSVHNTQCCGRISQGPQEELKPFFFKYYDSGVFNYTNKYFKYVCMTNMYSSKYQKHGKDWWESLAIVV